MKKLIAYYLRNQQGVETLEWIVMGACITALAILVYGGPNSTLVGALQGVVTDIQTKISNIP